MAGGPGAGRPDASPPSWFAQFVPALRQGLIDLVELAGLRDEDPRHGDARRAALVEAVAGGDGEAASPLLAVELDETQAQLLGRC